MKRNAEDRHCYDDIIDLPRHVSTAHPQMSRHDRAAQFSPFAALTGLGDAMSETARLTRERVEAENAGIPMGEAEEWDDEEPKT